MNDAYDGTLLKGYMVADANPYGEKREAAKNIDLPERSAGAACEHADSTGKTRRREASSFNPVLRAGLQLSGYQNDESSCRWIKHLVIC
ncbi:MAG: hypothetical protein ABI167_09540 [Nitrosospira sp.]